MVAGHNHFLVEFMYIRTYIHVCTFIDFSAPPPPFLQMWFLSRAGVHSYLLQELANHLNLERGSLQCIAVDIWWDRLPKEVEDCLPMYSKRRQAMEGVCVCVCVHACVCACVCVCS